MDGRNEEGIPVLTTPSPLIYDGKIGEEWLFFSIPKRHSGRGGGKGDQTRRVLRRRARSHAGGRGRRLHYQIQ